MNQGNCLLEVSWPYGPIASTFHTPIRVPLQPVQRLDFISDKDSTCAHLGGLIPPLPLGPNTFKDPPSRVGQKSRDLCLIRSSPKVPSFV